MMDLLSSQITSLTEERRVLLDRLATLGLGGPLFDLPATPEPEPTAEEAAADELEQLLHLRRRPSKLADALTRKAFRDYRKMQPGPSVKWVPAANEMLAALDRIENKQP